MCVKEHTSVLARIFLQSGGRGGRGWVPWPWALACSMKLDMKIYIFNTQNKKVHTDTFENVVNGMN